VELLLADGSLHADEAVKTMAPLFTLVSSVQTTVGGGVDICTIKDEQETGNIVHNNEVTLEQLKSAILNTMGVPAD